MPITSVQAESFRASPSALIELWTLDATAIGLDTVYRFTNGSSSSFQPVTLNGISYTPFPIMAENWGMDGRGQNNRPKLTLSNVRGFISNLLLQYGQLNGATISRQRVFSRYLDAANFPSPTPNWVTPDPTAVYPAEPFVINRKLVENQQIVSFELIPPIDLQNVQLPFRQIIANTCRWVYRQSGTCSYVGVPIADSANRTFTGTYYGMTLTDKGAYDASVTYARGDYVYIYSTLAAFSGVKMVYVCLNNGTLGTAPQGNPAAFVLDACSHNCAGCTLRFSPDSSAPSPLRGSFFPGTSRSPWISRA